MADQMKALLVMPGRGDDVEDIADQPIDAIIVEVFRIGPGIGLSVGLGLGGLGLLLGITSSFLRSGAFQRGPARACADAAA